MTNSLIFHASLLAFTISLTACGGGSDGSSGIGEASDSADNTSTDNTSTDNTSTEDQNNDNSDTQVILSDSSWSAGNDRVLGLSFTGTDENPVVTMLKGTPVDGQDGDVFSIRTAAYPATALNEIKSIDNLMDRRHFQDIETISTNGQTYAIACQDGSDTTGYTSAVSLHIFKTSDMSKVAEFDLVGSNFEARKCSGISAQFTQGSNDAMEAVVYYAGETMQTSGSPMNRYGRILRADFTVDTTVDVDATDAVVLDSLTTVVRAEIVDSISGVASSGDHVYYTYYDDSEGTNNLGYANAGLSPATTRNVDWSANDPFVSGVAQEMLVKDMFVIPGITTTDFDHIYMVSDSDASGIVVAAYRRDMNLKQPMAMSSDTATEHCSDIIAGVSDQGVGQKLWCHDATDSGKIIEVSSPVYPAD